MGKWVDTIDRGIYTPRVEGSKYRQGVQYTMCTGFNTPWIGESKTHLQRVQYNMSSGSKYHKQGVQYNMSRGGGQNIISRGFDIPWAGVQYSIDGIR